MLKGEVSQINNNNKVYLNCKINLRWLPTVLTVSTPEKG